MLCKNCGFKVDDHDEFCSGCGAKVEKVTEIKVVPAIDAKVNSEAQEPAQIKSRSWKKAIIAIATIIAIALIVLIIVQTKNNQPEAKQNQTEEYLTQDNLEDQVAAARQHRTDSGGTGLNTLTNAEISNFHITQYALLVNALNNMQNSAAEVLQYWTNDADMDESPELFADGHFSEVCSQPSQLTADADSSVMWGYTAAGASGGACLVFSQRDNTICFNNGCYSMSFGSDMLNSWNGKFWDAFCEDSWAPQNGSAEPIHNYTWKNSDVSQQEYDENKQNLSIATPSADTTDLFNVTVSGNPPELILDYEKYLQEDVEGYLGVSFADVDGDGKQEAAFVIQNATKKWWDTLSFENKQGDESCLNYWDYGTSIVLAEATDTGITLSAMKLNNPQDEIPGYYAQDMDSLALSTFYTRDNELILEAWDASYRVYTNGKTNGLSSPCLSYEVAKDVVSNTGTQTVTSIPTSTPSSDESGTIVYRVCCSSNSMSSPNGLEGRLEADGYDTCTYILQNQYVVQTGAFAEKGNADSLVEELNGLGYEAFSYIVNIG